MTQQTPKISLALSYGGAKGLAHIGVLQVLQESGYEVARIAGTSAGAIVGAMFAETLDGHEVKRRMQALISSKTFQSGGFSRFIHENTREANFWNQITCRIRDTIALHLAQSKLALLKPDQFQHNLEMLIHIRDFTQCRIPFLAVATDISSGQEFPLCAGDIIQAVLASSSIPGFLPPVDMDGALLNDGAICCPVPVKYAHDPEHHVTVAVSVAPKQIQTKPIDNALDIMIRAEEINLSYLCQAQAADADVVIEPESNGISWNEFHRLEEMVASGRKAAQEALPRIEQAVETKTSWWHRLCSWS